MHETQDRLRSSATPGDEHLEGSSIRPMENLRAGSHDSFWGRERP